MRTQWHGYQSYAGFGDLVADEPGEWVIFGILWDGDTADMPGWRQTNQMAKHHVPGGDRNIVHLLGLGSLQRSFRVLCESREVYAALARLQQTVGTLRVPAAMNELDVASEVDLYGTVMADIPEVVLLGLDDVSVWVDGSVSALASFWRSSRE